MRARARRGAAPGLLLLVCLSPTLPLASLTALSFHVYFSMVWGQKIQVLDVRSLSPPASSLSLQALVAESSHTHPILFVTAAGADPSLEIEEFALKAMAAAGSGSVEHKSDAAAGGSSSFPFVAPKSFHQVAMGSGQTDVAMELLRSVAREGAFSLPCVSLCRFSLVLESWACHRCIRMHCICTQAVGCCSKTCTLSRRGSPSSKK